LKKRGARIIIERSPKNKKRKRREMRAGGTREHERKTSMPLMNDQNFKTTRN